MPWAGLFREAAMRAFNTISCRVPAKFFTLFREVTARLRKPQSVYIEESIRIRMALDLLRADEGDSVTIICDNPDFNDLPDCAIDCCGQWTAWGTIRFTGSCLRECLEKAVADKFPTGVRHEVE